MELNRPVSRRDRRAEQLRGVALRTLDMTAVGLAGVYSSPGVADYLQSANLVLTEIADAERVRVRLALLRSITVGTASLPTASILWARDEASRDRAAILIALAGEIDVDTVESVIRRSHKTLDAFVLFPGKREVRISVLSPRAELFYLGIPSSLLAGVPRPAGSLVIEEEIEVDLLNRLIQSCQALYGLAPTRATESKAAAARSIVRAITELICEGSRRQTLYERASRIIATEYADPRLDLATVADRLGVSARTLQLAYQRENSSFSDSLRSIRTSAARRIRASHPGISLSQLASFAGFSSVPTLKRALGAGAHRGERKSGR